MNRDTAAAIAQKTGAAAIVYYPQIHVDEPDFKLADEITWCLEHVNELDEDDERILRDVIGRTILDPSGHRSKLNEVLDFLTDDEAA